jgi:hypothetical protein
MIVSVLLVLELFNNSFSVLFREHSKDNCINPAFSRKLVKNFPYCYNQIKNCMGEKQMTLQLESHKIACLLEIIDRNRWEKIRRLTSDDVEIKEENTAEEGEISAADVQAAVFASDTPFSQSIEKMLSDETVIAAFSDPEKAISFTCDNSIPNIILDIDPPSNTFHALDVFNALKILNPSIHFFVCTKRMTSQEKELFERQGAIIIEKPVLRKQVKWLIKNMVKK